MIYFWKAELDQDFYRSRSFPVAVEDVRLRIEHRFYQRSRYHVFEIQGGEASGIWDTTPFSIDFSCFTHGNLLDHGDFRHAYQLFLRSFLKTLRKQASYHPPLLLMKRILMRLPILTWKCPVCKKYNQWSRDFIEAQLLEHSLSIAPSTLSYLLTYRNEGLRSAIEDMVHRDQLEEFLPILAETLRRFFTDFEKIYEQTSMDPVHILKNLIDILLKHARPFAMDDIEKYETECSKEMKSYLFRQFKFLKTRTLKVSHFPRTMMILREVFTSVMHIWRSVVDGNATMTRRSSPGTVVLLGYLLFRDPVLSPSPSPSPQHQTPLLVTYPKSIDKPIVRPMLPPEIDQLQDYHPVLRPYLFLP